MSDILCQHCGSIDDYRTEMKSGQQVAYCNSCGNYIKNIPYKTPQFYVGKYEGMPISECTDISYMEWFMTINKKANRVNAAIQERIKQLKNG